MRTRRRAADGPGRSARPPRGSPAPRRALPGGRAPGVLLLLATAVLTAAGCDTAAGRNAAVARAQDARPALPDSVFAGLVAELSEPGAYFDTDNLISNESSYLHVMGELEERDVRGGAYLGVGPDQNFAYVAAVEPALAFLVDIRRDNLLQHLWYKALFEMAETRLDYLCLVVARRCGGESAGLGVDALVARVDRASPVADLTALLDRVTDRAVDFGVPLTGEDRATLRSIHQRFAADGLDLRFNTHGRPPLPEYPTFRRLILERDERGRAAGFLADEAAFRVVRDLQRANRVVPVVGDLAGGHALRAIGREARRRGLTLSAFYTSNVEYYLFRDGTFPRFVANLRALPIDDGSVLIRSFFGRFRRLPTARPGHASTQLLEPVPAFLERWEDRRIPSYGALVRDAGAGP